MARWGPWPLVLGIAALYLDELLSFYPKCGGELPYGPGLRPGLAVLQPPDRVVGYARALLQLVQGQDPALPQLPQLPHVHLHHVDSLLLDILYHKYVEIIDKT